ncbi:filamin-B-like [Branchiostoma floridae x Branchiostoma belcheri]
MQETAVTSSQASRVTASGPGLHTVPVNRATSFVIDQTRAVSGKVDVTITGPSAEIVPCHYPGNQPRLLVQYTPKEVGDYDIEVKLSGMQIFGSPFTSHAYDVSGVKLNIPRGKLGQQVVVPIDTSSAGSGTLEVEVRARGAEVANRLVQHAPGKHQLMFRPGTADPHDIMVRYNNELTPGTLQLQHQYNDSSVSSSYNVMVRYNNELTPGTTVQ